MGCIWRTDNGIKSMCIWLCDRMCIRLCDRTLPLETLDRLQLKNKNTDSLCIHIYYTDTAWGGRCKLFEYICSLRLLCRQEKRYGTEIFEAWHWPDMTFSDSDLQPIVLTPSYFITSLKDPLPSSKRAYGLRSVAKQQAPFLMATPKY